jgi:hypothetical protein
MHCVDVFPVDEFVRVTFSITPRLMSPSNRVLKKRRSVLVGLLNPLGFMNRVCTSEALETHEGYDQVFGWMCVVRGVQKKFDNSTAKYVNVCEVERVDRSKFGRLFGFNCLLSRPDGARVFLLVTFLTDRPPHRTGVIEVFENTKVPSDTCPDQFDSAINQWVETLR